MVSAKDTGLDWDAIRENLNELIDFSKPKVDNEIVDKFIARIVALGDNRFAWYVNVSGASTEEVQMVIEGRKNHATICIDKDADNGEDGESSIHNCLVIGGKNAMLGKKYSREKLLHRQL